MPADRLRIGLDLASRIRSLLQALLNDLERTLADPRFADVAGMRESIASIVDRVRELDGCLPANLLPPLTEPGFSRSSLPGAECPMPIRLPFDAACDLVALASARTRELD